MQDVKAGTLRIVGFLCNWCSYGGADTAGVSRFRQPTDLRIIRVPCSGRVDPLFVVRTLLSGADGVLVSGCHPRDCHYSDGNFYARRRLEMLKQFLPFIGIDGRRFHYTWVSASEGQRWQQTVTQFTKQIHELGPAADDAEKAAAATPGVIPRAAGAAGVSVPSKEQVEALKKAAADALSTVDVVVGWKQGFDPLHVEPCFIEKPEQVEQLVFSPLCEQNLAPYLTRLKGKKVGVIVKGCDSRTVVQLLQEGLIARDNVYVIGIPCTGTVSVKKAAAAAGGEKIDSVSFENDALKVGTASGEKRISLADIVRDKCAPCKYPAPLIHDVVVGEPAKAAAGSDASGYDDIAAIEAMTLPERRAYWEKALGRCVRCYACRNACPLCVCEESCIAETRDPHWMTQESTPAEKSMFHMVHALHTAGRCTECGECERACPMGVPLMKLKKKINKEMLDLFGYTAGVKCDDKPPLYTFKVDEERIEEHKLS